MAEKYLKLTKSEVVYLATLVETHDKNAHLPSNEKLRYMKHERKNVLAKLVRLEKQVLQTSTPKAYKWARRPKELDHMQLVPGTRMVKMYLENTAGVLNQQPLLVARVPDDIQINKPDSSFTIEAQRYLYKEFRTFYKRYEDLKGFATKR